MKTIEINTKNQIRAIIPLLMYSFIQIIIIFWCYFKFQSTDGMFIFYILMFLQIAPTIYIHYKFFKNDLNKKVVLKDKYLEILARNGKEIIVEYDKISNITICKSANKDKGGIPIFVFENYYFCEVNLKNGKKYIFTSLLDYDLDKTMRQIENIEFIRKKGLSFFPKW